MCEKFDNFEGRDAEETFGNLNFLRGANIT